MIADIARAKTASEGMRRRPCASRLSRNAVRVFVPVTGITVPDASESKRQAPRQALVAPRLSSTISARFCSPSGSEDDARDWPKGSAATDAAATRKAKIPLFRSTPRGLRQPAGYGRRSRTAERR
jgi:hypothetical protein